MPNTVGELQAFLEAMRYRQAHAPEPDVAVGRFPFVTISRQTGAGGHSLAEALVQTMQREPDPIFQGWQMFDQELCTRLVEDPKLKVSMRALMAEEYHPQIEDALFNLMLGDTPQDVVVKKIFQTVRTLAMVGKAIIVGRAGSCVTKGLPLGVHVRLVAPEPARIRRMMQLLQVGEPEAREAVHKQDRDRARLVRDYFGRDINDPLLYDAVWNTQAASLEAVASSILTLIRDRVQRQHSSGKLERVEKPALAARPRETGVVCGLL